MKKIVLLGILMGMTGFNLLSAQEVINLYPGQIPGAKQAPSSYKEIQTVKAGKVTGLSKVFQPTLAIYQPVQNKRTGVSVIICPGGGYTHLAIGHEGQDVAEAFMKIGVTAFVLKYRLPDDTTMVDKAFGPLQDAEQAIYTVRKNASKWNIDPAKIGIMGFSAGGHLASSLAVHYKDIKISNPEKVSLRPDFAVLIYPVISFTNSAHKGSEISLLGDKATQAQMEYFSNELHVDAETPISFLVQANDDKTVPVENSILFNQALVKNKVPVEMHLFQAGGHGFGLHNKTTPDEWFEWLTNWMQENSLLKPKP